MQYSIYVFGFYVVFSIFSVCWYMQILYVQHFAPKYLLLESGSSSHKEGTVNYDCVNLIYSYYSTYSYI